MPSPLPSTATNATTKAAPAPAGPARGLAAVFSPRRWLVAAIAALVVFLPLNLMWQSSAPSLLLRVGTLAAAAVLVYGVAEQWPRRLPRWLARWALQVLAVAAVAPLVVAVFYIVATEPDAPPFWRVQLRLFGFVMLSLMGMLVGPWLAMAALMRGRDAELRHQAQTFERERSLLERQAQDARMHLLQAQVQPHFLFNTLANVRALVNAGSPQASTVLDSLIAYLRAAVPRLNETDTTLQQELQLVKAYLEVMHMRMPDRLQFEIDADPGALALRCPPMALLTLVENAVRHGIDPSEAGGRIDIRVRRSDGRCQVRVADTGVGLRHAPAPGAHGGLCTGLTTLRERLRLAWGEQGTLRLTEQAPHGMVAELEFPATERSA